MRVLMIAMAATLLVLPAAGAPKASETMACAAKPSAQAAVTDYSAAKKKALKKTAKIKKEKVEYLRAAPM